MDKSANLKDHRQIGQELDLFSFHDIAPGAVFWHPKGYLIYRTLLDFIRKKTEREGYQEISTPIMVKNSLFKDSGHWEHFGEHNMYNLSLWEDEELKELSTLIGKAEDEIKKYVEKRLKEDQKTPFPFYYKIRNFHGVDLDVQILNYDTKKGVMFTPPVNYSLKPMNCPESTLVYRNRTRSYQDLPLKFSDYGILYRREPSGVLGGLFRVRQFTIDDAHLFVRDDQIQKEIHELIELVKELYSSLNFKPHFYFATKPDKAMGDPKLWEVAEKDLELALKDAGVKYDTKPKDGAFYGPKIDIHINDSQDRDWQLATIQLDFQIPERMALTYIDKDGKRKRPVMIHRAIFGSFERFIGILIEHFQGAFPLWLSPVQVKVLPLTDRQLEYGRKITNELKDQDIRAELDERNETLQAKIRNATLQKVPYMVIIGDREEKSQKVTLRTRGGQDLGQMELTKFIAKIKLEIEKKS